MPPPGRPRPDGLWADDRSSAVVRSGRCRANLDCALVAVLHACGGVGHVPVSCGEEFAFDELRMGPKRVPGFRLAAEFGTIFLLPSYFSDFFEEC